MPSDSINGQPLLGSILERVLKMLVPQQSMDQQAAPPLLSLYQTCSTLNVHIVSTSERGLMVKGHD